MHAWTWVALSVGWLALAAAFILFGVLLIASSVGLCLSLSVKLELTQLSTNLN